MSESQIVMLDEVAEPEVDRRGEPDNPSSVGMILTPCANF
jgi:hypothetical protein